MEVSYIDIPLTIEEEMEIEEIANRHPFEDDIKGGLEYLMRTCKYSRFRGSHY